MGHTYGTVTDAMDIIKTRGKWIYFKYAREIPYLFNQ
jgi:hypothetical protein